MEYDIALVEKLLNDKEYYKNYSLKNLSKYHTGGLGDYVVFAKTVEELKELSLNLRNVVPFYVLGLGSNVLIADGGLKGVTVSTRYLTKTEIKTNLMVCECGAKLKDVIEELKLNSFGGLEFAVGIPASVGGACAMNAGCFNKSIQDVVVYVETEKGIYSNKDCNFSYRHSRFLDGETVLKVCFKLKPQEIDVIEEKIAFYKGSRKNPKGRSCGSVFKNEGYFAGKLIDEAGLKGFSVGGAYVSTEHANFIIADDNAKSSDIKRLIETIKEKVFLKFDVELKEELTYLGDFNDN